MDVVDIDIDEIREAFADLTTRGSNDVGEYIFVPYTSCAAVWHTEKHQTHDSPAHPSETLIHIGAEYNLVF
jgi:hypothetical protein